MANPNIFDPITYSASTKISNAEYRGYCTSNNLALTSVFETKIFGSSGNTDGWIDLTGGTENSKVSYIPFTKKSSADISSKDNVMYLDTSNVLSIKINGKIKPLQTTTDLLLVKEVTTLPSPISIPNNYSTIVIHDAKLKWYDTKNSTWKTVTST
ncbi:MAG: hypothetical protein KAH32_07390 [Chlamydiia bacterium]|nr:hypothetical protein [Chlamydiia bacterium]